MKILQIQVSEVAEAGLVLGLGDDYKMYYWHYDQAKWLFYGNEEAAPVESTVKEI